MRFSHGWKKYGWRTMFLVLHRIGERWHAAHAAWRRTTLCCFCRVEVGRATRIESGCTFSAGAWFRIGQGVYIGRGSTFVIGQAPGQDEQQMQIGDNTWITQNFLMLSLNGVCIGSNVLIGEGVSVRDSTHAYSDPNRPIREQGDVYGTILIEDDVWIGRGCLIQGRPEGVTIGRGAILAANSVASRSIPAGEVWGGVPARFLKKRTEHEQVALLNGRPASEMI